MYENLIVTTNIRSNFCEVNSILWFYTKNRKNSMPEPRRIDLRALFLFVAAEAVGEVECDGPGIEPRTHVDILSCVADLHGGIDRLENIRTTCREACAALVESPFGSDIKGPAGIGVEGSLNGRGLVVARNIERDVGLARETHGILHIYHADPLRAVE